MDSSRIIGGWVVVEESQNMSLGINYIPGDTSWSVSR